MNVSAHGSISAVDLSIPPFSPFGDGESGGHAAPAIERLAQVTLDRFDSKAAEQWMKQADSGAVLTEIDFKHGGNGEQMKTEGFSGPEAYHRWSMNWRSAIHVPLPSIPALDQNDFALELSAWPCTSGDFKMGQSLTIRADNRTLFSAYIGHDQMIGFQIPASIVQRDMLQLEFLHPDFAQPTGPNGRIVDGRQLALAFRRLRLLRVPSSPGINVRSDYLDRSLPGDELHHAVARITRLETSKLLERFVSMGVHCEFGLVQRRLGCDVMSMHRFGRTFTADLVRALDTGYEGIADPALIEPYCDPGSKEWMVRHKRYGLYYHTHIIDESRTADDIRRDEVIRLGYYRRKLMEALADDRLIFVRTLHPSENINCILPAYYAFRRAGGKWFMAVALADADNPPGIVEWHLSGMLVGYVDHFANVLDASMMDLENWLRVCANAFHHVERCLAARERPDNQVNQPAPSEKAT